MGEPTGARPNGYQERGGFTLPHSGLQVSCSILRYRFQPGRDDLHAVMPDRRIDPDWRLFEAGRDPVLEWIRAQPLVLPRPDHTGSLRRVVQRQSPGIAALR